MGILPNPAKNTNRGMETIRVKSSQICNLLLKLPVLYDLGSFDPKNKSF